MGYSTGDDSEDLEYFRTMIESKVQQSENQQGYMEQLAMKTGDFDAEEELQNALDEIKKNEKDIGMIA